LNYQGADEIISKNEDKFLDSIQLLLYNPSHSEVVREKCLIEKDAFGESIRRKSSPKSSDEVAEESHVIFVCK